MHHITAFAESILDGTVTVPSDVSAVPDDVLFTSGDDVRISQVLASLIGVFAFGSRSTIARFESPSMRAFLNLAMPFFRLGQAPLNSGDSFLSLFDQPVRLVPGEALNYTSDGGGDATTAEDIGALVLLAEGPPQPVGGEIRTVRATTSFTSTQRVWSSDTLTFDEELPGGSYQLVGGAVVDANVMGFRFIFPGQGARPGGLGSPDHEDRVPRGQRRGGWGVWGSFDVNQPPTVEVLSIGGTDVNPVVFLDLIKVGG